MFCCVHVRVDHLFCTTVVWFTFTSFNYFFCIKKYFKTNQCLASFPSKWMIYEITDFLKSCCDDPNFLNFLKIYESLRTKTLSVYLLRSRRLGFGLMLRPKERNTKKYAIHQYYFWCLAIQFARAVLFYYHLTIKRSSARQTIPITGNSNRTNHDITSTTKLKRLYIYFNNNWILSTPNA